MASAAVHSEDISCPVCGGPYKEPRKLPGCVHSFCETCILTYVLNLKKDGKLELTFECPVCRLPSDAPENGNVTIEWVQTMSKTLSKETNDFNSDGCSQCQYLEHYTKSDYYCTVCRERFCDACSKNLHSFKMNTKHVLINLNGPSESEDVHEKAVKLLDTFLTCSKHPEKSVELYCADEEEFCCLYCSVQNHNNCPNLVKIKEMSEPYEETKSKELSSSFLKLTNHIQAVIDLIKEQDKEVKVETDKLLDEFQEMKQKVIRLFDVLEETLTEEAKSKRKLISIDNLDKVQEMKDITYKLTVVTYLIDNLVCKIPPEVAVICIHEAGKIFKNTERSITERGPAQNTQGIVLKTENILKTIVNLGPNETEQLASIETVDRSVPLPSYNGNTPLRTRQVNRIASGCIIAEDSPGLTPRYGSVMFLPDNQLVLSDMYYGIVCMADENLKPVASYNLNVKEITADSALDANFICATYMVNNLIAVSVYADKTIHFLSADKQLEHKGEVACKYFPRAIYGLRNKDLAVLWERPIAIGIITVTAGSYTERVYFTTDKNGRKIRANKRMAIDEERGHVILPCNGDRIVYCFDFEANQIFAYKNAEFKDLLEVTVDGDGNIYVCEVKQRLILVLSPAGINVRLIKEGCPIKPLGIGFNREGNKFAVSQVVPFSQHISLFSLDNE